MINQKDFLAKHKILREASETVLGLSQSQKDFKDNATILIYGGVSYGDKLNYMATKFYIIKRTKLLQSKSKQPRIVSVVCK